jgi:hypothetical protein
MIHAQARKTKLFQHRLALDLKKGLRVRQFAHNDRRPGRVFPLRKISSIDTVYLGKIVGSHQHHVCLDNAERPRLRRRGWNVAKNDAMTARKGARTGAMTAKSGVKTAKMRGAA